MAALSLGVLGLGYNLRSQIQNQNDFLESELVIAIHEIHQLQRETLRLKHQLLLPSGSPQDLKLRIDLVQSRISIIQKQSQARLEQYKIYSGEFSHIQAVIETWPDIKSQLEKLQYDPTQQALRQSIERQIDILEISLNQLARIRQERQWQDYERQVKQQQASLNHLTVLLGFYFFSAILFAGYTLNFLETRQRLLDEMKQLSTTDELTQIANRRYFNQVLQREWNRMIREQRAIALILCDIDCFKQYNDNYGHQAGDDCLHQVAQALARSTRRAGEFVARYGGEEFVIVASNVSLQQVQELTARLHSNIRQLMLEHRFSSVSSFVTLSIGVAIGIPMIDTKPEQALQIADKALYEAKSKGRNQSCLHQI